MAVVGNGIPGQRDVFGGEVESIYVEELHIEGSHDAPLDLGGKLPQSCVLSFSAKAVVDGYFRKGDRVTVELDLLVTDASVTDSLDKQTGICTEAVQKHKARVTDLRPASE